MTRYLSRDRAAIAAALAAPIAAAAILLPFRASWPNTNVALPAGETELRVLSNGQYLGRFMLTPKPGSRPSRQARLVAVTLADLTGRALGDATHARSAR